jgi:hypothetical protein
MMSVFTRSFVLGFLILIGTTGLSQNMENSIFWEITGKDLNKPSYLFGTIHFMHKKEFFITKSMKERLKECEIFSTETLYGHHTTHELNKAAHLPEHQSLADFMSEADFNAIKNLFTNQLGVSNLRFDLIYSRLKPQILLISMTMLTLGNDVRFFEQELLEVAKKYKVEYIGLETIEREIEALEQFPMEDQVKALIDAVNNFDKHLNDYNLLIRYYKENQDLEKIIFETMEPAEQNEIFKKAFYDDRNVEWIPVMKRKMNLAPTFFAVGAAHLGGEKGLLQLLKDEGYTLTPIETF